MEALGRTMLLGAEVTLPWAGLDAGDWRLRFNALAPIVGGDRWKLAGTFAPTAAAARRTRQGSGSSRE